MSQSWNYQTRKGGCVACDRSFVEGETLFSLLSMGEESLERGDLCSSCFESHDQANDLYWWRTQHSEKRGGLKLDLDALLALVMRLEEDVRDGALDFRFLVALLLVRHRKLKLASVTKKGKKEFLELRKPRAKKTRSAGHSFSVPSIGENGAPVSDGLLQSSWTVFTARTLPFSSPRNSTV